MRTRFVVDTGTNVSDFIPGAKRTGVTHEPRPGGMCYCDEDSFSPLCTHALRAGEEWEVAGRLTRSRYRKLAGGDIGRPRGYKRLFPAE